MSAAPPVVVRGSGAAPAAVDQEPVVGLGEGLDPVGVGGEGEGRLGLAERDHTLGMEPTERGVLGPVTPEGSGDLGVDVVAEVVAGMVERAVARRVDLGDALADSVVVDAGIDSHLAALDPDELGRHTDPHGTGALELRSEVGEVGRRVDAAADVQPFDDDRAVEVGGVGRPTHENPGPVVGGAGLGQLDPAVERDRSGGGVGPRGSCGDVLVLLAPRRRLVGGGRAEEDPVPSGQLLAEVGGGPVGPDLGGGGVRARNGVRRARGCR